MRVGIPLGEAKKPAGIVPQNRRPVSRVYVRLVPHQIADLHADAARAHGPRQLSA